MEGFDKDSIQRAVGFLTAKQPSTTVALNLLTHALQDC
jgi:hypothetical protein